jgi:hypothetical protein
MKMKTVAAVHDRRKIIRLKWATVTDRRDNK